MTVYQFLIISDGQYLKYLAQDYEKDEEVKYFTIIIIFCLFYFKYI